MNLPATPRHQCHGERARVTRFSPPDPLVARAALPPFRTRGDKAKAPARDAGALKCRSCEQRAGWAQEGLLSDTTPAGAGKFPAPRWRARGACPIRPTVSRLPLPTRSLPDPQYWRQRAAMARALAEQVDDP